MRFIIAILIGALIGWIAGLIMKTKKGFLVNMLIGIIGSALGTWIAGLLNLPLGAVGSFLFSIAGSCLLIFIIRKLFKK